MNQQAAFKNGFPIDIPRRPFAARPTAVARYGAMAGGVQVASSAHVAYKPAPFSADDVVCGNPVARNSLIFRSADGLQVTVMWHCTAGSFRWFYDEDETILLLDGGMTLRFDDGTSRTCVAGETVFFPAGTTCVWVIDHEVRKLAFFRQPAPRLMALPLRLARRLVGLSGLRARRSRRFAKAGSGPATNVVALAAVARGEAAGLH
jgi:uncharacterized cupin superfamily protein